MMLLSLFLSLGLTGWLAAPDGIRANGPLLEEEAVTCHLPVSEHLRNLAGRDGLGLCVFTSIDLAARWANEGTLIGIRDYMTTQPGGGWPEKVDEVIHTLADRQHKPVPPYLQHTGGDVDFLKRALKTGRYVCVTYSGADGVFYRGSIYHMVNLVHMSDRFAVIQDNNFPGKWLWLPTAEFVSRWKALNGGWAIVLLKPGPPPIPTSIPTPAKVPPRAAAPSNFPVICGDSPAKPDLAESEITNYGLHPERLRTRLEYRLNGQSISRGQALSAFDALEDDSGKGRLTVVGDTAFREQVRRDWESAPELAPYRDKLLFQDYPTDHWAVTSVGFAPGITFQPAPRLDGKSPVVFRFRDYSSGPAGLALALRQADPNYKPDADPDPNKKPVLPNIALPSLNQVPASVWILGGLALLLFISKKKESAP
ncbi:hypothetical protein KIH39_20080 [Telmatocola sphagniphila]|uniref:Peptidase C39-like domain-containing protein n=1 Tax=Telmatocola sphagniphila TaxID=1123043 RepID=A0A8E6B4D9_9BACT|nr:hypothetical protein [Telmatocola sphagniphila]QVL31127.1 hypothetical protein KIH39_20080 [Telmatocola sphagniphila]